MGIEKIPLSPHENKPDAGLASALELKGVDSALGMWLRELPPDAQRTIYSRVFNTDTAVPGDLKFITDSEELSHIRVDMEQLLALEQEHQFDQARTLGNSIAKRIEAATG